METNREEQMRRSTYFEYIEERLDFLSYRIKNRGKINLLSLNIYSENFFADMVSKLLGYDLKNLNAIEQNMEGIDLIDEKHKIIAQVSSTCTKQKIGNSLKKEVLSAYSGFRFIFIAITGDANNLRKDTYKNPHGVNFSPQNDIYDIKSILNLVLNMKIDEQRAFYCFIKDVLGTEVDAFKEDSNLAAIINILSQENLAEVPESLEINQFEIERKIAFNNLISARYTIDEFKVFYSRLDEKYAEFDKQGANKSLSVFSVLRNLYAKLSGEGKNDHEIFYLLIDNAIEIIRNSRNYVEIPYEELEMCVSIIVVDAFVRCKIFRNPEGYSYVATR